MKIKVTRVLDVTDSCCDPLAESIIRDEIIVLGTDGTLEQVNPQNANDPFRYDYCQFCGQVVAIEG